MPATSAPLAVKAKHKKKQLHIFFMLMNHNIDSSEFKCNSFVRTYGALKDFPEIDAFTWTNIDNIGVLHSTQIKAIKDINSKYNIWSNLTINHINKSNLYG